MHGGDHATQSVAPPHEISRVHSPLVSNLWAMAEAPSKEAVSERVASVRDQLKLLADYL
jgi:hypothetical protein